MGIELSSGQTDRLRTLAVRAAEVGGALGLGRYRDLADVWEHHVLDSLSFFRPFPQPRGPLVDVGSGAGFPGLVLAIAGEELDVVLMESRKRPVWFLSQMLLELGLSNARVVRGRAEALAESEEYAGRFRFATARGVRRPMQAAGLLRPFLEPSGSAVIYTGPTALGREVVGEAVPTPAGYSSVEVWEEKGIGGKERILLVLEAVGGLSGRG